VTEDIRTFPFQSEFRGEIAPDVAELRARSPLSRVRLPNGTPAWLVLGYEESQTVMSDSRFSRAVRYANERATSQDEGGCPHAARINKTKEKNKR